MNKEQNDERSVANPLNSSTVDGSMGESEIERMAEEYAEKEWGTTVQKDDRFEYDKNECKINFIAGCKATLEKLAGYKAAKSNQ